MTAGKFAKANITAAETKFTFMEKHGLTAITTILTRNADLSRNLFFKWLKEQLAFLHGIY